MTTIIAGSRTLGKDALYAALAECPWDITEVVSGGANGIDTCGELWATENNIPIKRFPAYWDNFGKMAGFLRNTQMAEYTGDKGALLAVWDGKSRGTKHMIQIAGRYGLRIKVWTPPQPRP